MAGDPRETPPIRWRVRLRSAPETVFAALDQPEGRRRFWAESAEEPVPGWIDFRFTDGQSCRSQVLDRVPPHLFRISYFAGSIATFELEPNGLGGTDLQLTEHRVPRESWSDNHAGWVTVLLALKASVDFGADLRNHDPRCTWGAGYVDV